MRDLFVELGADSYNIAMGRGALETLPAALAEMQCGRLAVVTDSNVWALHGERLLAELPGPAQVIEMPPGEASKSLASLAEVYSGLAESRFGRGDTLLAFGGGVIGDLCGFAAATYMRGVRYLQLPTTLLAQIDSSVGGKTAVNIAEGKNLVGAFYQPRAVVMDTSLLETLPEREWRSGLAEMIKYGAIASQELFEQLLHWKREDRDALETAIYECCDIKRRVVQQDEKDRGARMLLNFGHTFGHAVEALGSYRKYNHGEGVAIGMVLAAQVGERLGITPGGTATQLETVLQAHGLSTECPYPPADLLEPMRRDKKAEGESVRLILLREIGQAVAHSIRYSELKNLLEHPAMGVQS